MKAVFLLALLLAPGCAYAYRDPYRRVAVAIGQSSVEQCWLEHGEEVCDNLHGGSISDALAGVILGALARLAGLF